MLILGFLRNVENKFEFLSKWVELAYRDVN
jgi:hypothetical protein